MSGHSVTEYHIQFAEYRIKDSIYSEAEEQYLGYQITEKPFLHNDQWSPADLGLNIAGHGSHTIGFKSSPNRTIIKRRTYKVFDLLAEVGGFYGALSGVFLLVCRLVNYDALYYSLTPELFEVKLRKEKAKRFK